MLNLVVMTMLETHKLLDILEKQNVVGNPRWASNIQGPHNRHKVYNPNDIAKTTIKETTLEESIRNNLAPADRAPKSRIYDPNDIAKNYY